MLKQSRVIIIINNTSRVNVRNSERIKLMIVVNEIVTPRLSVTPESIIIPIISCILGFPLLALMVICCLRRRAKLARERARRRNCDLDHGALSLVRFSPVHRLGKYRVYNKNETGTLAHA